MLVHKACKPLNMSYSIEPGVKFEPEGRVMLAEVIMTIMNKLPSADVS